ncbi:hypothetical protein K0M31_010877 [Melipona bicolor]|uniref:Uncharacterized protein n=1 Tax=Melipona bicolor TaxID=60889 RepID=A0AA40KI79_9HYME|nr:hypothetical protein K0M31_010877 [Melipona bicolor]
MGEDGSANGNQTWVVVLVRVFLTALPLRGCRLHGLQDAPSFKMVAMPPAYRAETVNVALMGENWFLRSNMVSRHDMRGLGPAICQRDLFTVQKWKNMFSDE